MTREEAIEILQGAIKKPNTKDGYLGQAINMAIKALEQEPVLDKIRSDVEDLDVFYDNDYFSDNRDAMFKCNDVLQILDKYKAESEIER